MLLWRLKALSSEDDYFFAPFMYVVVFSMELLKFAVGYYCSVEASKSRNCSTVPVVVVSERTLSWKLSYLAPLRSSALTFH